MRFADGANHGCARHSKLLSKLLHRSGSLSANSIPQLDHSGQAIVEFAEVRSKVRSEVKPGLPGITRIKRIDELHSTGGMTAGRSFGYRLYAAHSQRSIHFVPTPVIQSLAARWIDLINRNTGNLYRQAKQHSYLV